MFAVMALMHSSAGIAEAQRRPMTAKARANLQEKVRHELVMLPYYGVFDWLSFRVNDNYTVTLQGFTVRPTLKEDAERVVRKLEGVEGVTNRIEVLPLSPNDDRLRRAAYSAIFSTVGLDRYARGAVPSIHIIVSRGHITLLGVVRTEADKNLAGIRANQVSGAFSVKNLLIAEVPAKPKKK